MVTNFDDGFVGCFVDKRSGVVDPTAQRGLVGRIRVAHERDAGFVQIFKAHHNFGGVTFGVVRDIMDEYLMHETFEAVVFTVVQKSRSVFVIADFYRVASSQLDQILKYMWTSICNALWLYGRWTKETFGVETGEGVIARAEETGEAEGEEVGGVARAGEGISWNSKLCAADGDVDFRVEEL